MSGHTEKVCDRGKKAGWWGGNGKMRNGQSERKKKVLTIRKKLSEEDNVSVNQDY